MKEITGKKDLLSLYAQTSKHSNYQVLASCLEKYLPSVNVKSRFEKERLLFINSNISLKDKKVIDIGGNTGFFSIESIEKKARSVTYIEGNSTHSNFVKAAIGYLAMENKISIKNEYVDFNQKLADIYDVGFLLNVLHHIGDDYGNATDSKEALKNIVNSLEKVAYRVNILVLQLGFNWKGNVKLPLFEQGSKSDVINFVRSNITDFYEIQEIGIAERVEDNIFYRNLGDSNIQRDDALGEFLNRPIFILKSKVCGL